MAGLQTKLKKDRLAPVQLREEIQYIFRETVRTGADGEGDDLRRLHGGLVKLPESVHGGVCVGKRLKVGDIPAPCELFFGLRLPPGNLFRDGEERAFRIVSASSLTAENTAAHRQGAVPVGTGKPAVQADLIYFFSEHFL